MSSDDGETTTKSVVDHVKKGIETLIRLGYASPTETKHCVTVIVLTETHARMMMSGTFMDGCTRLISAFSEEGFVNRTRFVFLVPYGAYTYSAQHDGAIYVFTAYSDSWKGSPAAFLDFAYAYMERAVAAVYTLDDELPAHGDGWKGCLRSLTQKMMKVQDPHTVEELFQKGGTSNVSPFGCFLETPPREPRSNYNRIMNDTMNLSGRHSNHNMYTAKGNLEAAEAENTQSSASRSVNVGFLRRLRLPYDQHVSSSSSSQGARRKLGRGAKKEMHRSPQKQVFFQEATAETDGAW